MTEGYVTPEEREAYAERKREGQPRLQRWYPLLSLLMTIALCAVIFWQRSIIDRKASLLDRAGCAILIQERRIKDLEAVVEWSGTDE
ncbi:MAG: hypothetical protein O7G84_00910 [Gammaproteobacteria bacterium]|nr:hypothetical protein [Gammaproteobacteria bacterium]